MQNPDLSKSFKTYTISVETGNNNKNHIRKFSINVLKNISRNFLNRMLNRSIFLFSKPSENFSCSI